jgi:hypothetical protein
MAAQPLQGIFSFIQNLWLQRWPDSKPSALEQRVIQLETIVAQLSKAPATTPPTAWWDDIAGVFENDPLFDQAMALGADYRRSKEQFIESADP